MGDTFGSETGTSKFQDINFDNENSREQDDNETLILIKLLKYFALEILGSLEESLAKNNAADQLKILRSKVTRGEPSPKVKQSIAAMDVIFLKSVDTSSSFLQKSALIVRDCCDKRHESGCFPMEHPTANRLAPPLLFNVNFVAKDSHKSALLIKIKDNILTSSPSLIFISKDVGFTGKKGIDEP